MGFTHFRNLAVSLILVVLVLALNFTEISGGLTITSSSFKPGRKLLQTENISESSAQSDDTVRVDPLDKFKKYRGGFDITNKHYWSSTVFTGIYGYAIGVVWLLCGIAYGGFLLISKCCCKSNKNKKLKKRTPCDKQCALWPILLVTCFTILAITASGIVLGGSARFHSRAKTVLNIIMDTANEASETIYSTTGAMKDIRDNLEASNIGVEASTFLTSTSHDLDSEAADIERQARKNRRLIDRGLKIAYIITTTTISLNLIAVIALTVFGFLRFRKALYWLIVLCWLLTAMCWLFFGVYFFLEKFAGDTCRAFSNFQQDPYNNTLSSILPCDELRSAEPVLTEVSAGIYDLVNQVNANISVLQSTLHSNLVQVCNPFSGPPDYQYQSGNCPANTVPIRDIPQVLKIFTCSNTNNGTCKTGEFISASDFKTAEAYTSSLQNLLDAYPEMESLVDCQLVKDAFSEILLNHCKPLKRYVRMVWIAMIFLSVIMVALILIWVKKAHHEQRHHFSDGSVKPHSTSAHMMDRGTTKAINNTSNSSSVL
ncbi:uncharacterized protein LOC131150953 [Malania oleifera]|uniref:uncharacterized protein LOC131150953 n=1 Tax=Malania oleifera TaxID=397392 RepID=UPI0025AE4DF2|nr:uncharacterized protein LOC131150953 [Malania oleifera]